MKRTVTFVRPSRTASCRLPNGETIELPVAPGILKHLDEERLAELLVDPDVATKYTVEALRVAPWSVLGCFPPAWLRRCMTRADLPERRARAIEFLLS